jgi:hypothetical protein
MIIGISALIAILFFGGINETFLIDKIEKGVKEYVVDKERKKEITADLKEASKYIKGFYKQRSAQFKQFKEMNLSREVEKSEMEAFFEGVMKSRLEFQNKVIDDRISIIAKLMPGEWDSIMVYSQQSVVKKKEKAEEKEAKGKVSTPFAKTYKAIQDKVMEADKKESLKRSLDAFIASETKAIEQLKSMNSQDNKVLTNKNATREELLGLGNRMNEFRKKAFTELIDLHFSVRQNTNETEWTAVMKAFNKELSVTAH